MASFMLGYATLIEQDFTLAWTGRAVLKDGVYVADDCRVEQKLTLNLGLRWDYFSPYVGSGGPHGRTLTRATGIIGRRRGRSRPPRRCRARFQGLAPRFGFAYQAMPHTVVRGGFGLFYNPNGNGGELLRLQRHVPLRTDL